MNTIPFPTSYKQALLKKTKNTTIRLRSEVGKYKEGKVYTATSYTGKNWDIKIKVLKIISTKVEKLGECGISSRSIDMILSKEKVTQDSPVDILKFRII